MEQRSVVHSRAGPATVRGITGRGRKIGRAESEAIWDSAVSGGKTQAEAALAKEAGIIFALNRKSPSLRTPGL